VGGPHLEVGGGGIKAFPWANRSPGLPSVNPRQSCPERPTNWKTERGEPAPRRKARGEEEEVLHLLPPSEALIPVASRAQSPPTAIPLIASYTKNVYRIPGTHDRDTAGLHAGRRTLRGCFGEKKGR
jgi:hypothetical protein